MTLDSLVQAPEQTECNSAWPLVQFYGSSMATSDIMNKGENVLWPHNVPSFQRSMNLKLRG